MRRATVFLRDWFRHLPRRAKVAVAIVGVLVLGAAVYWLIITGSGPDTCMRKGATNVVHDGPAHECVGITDGAFSFDPSLTAVEKKIEHENTRVTEQHPKNYVSVVFMLPISAGSGSTMSMTSVVEQFRGAYVAQYYANRANVEGATPYIRLLVGNDGYQGSRQETAVRIITGARAGQRIDAVAGLGLSLDSTETAVRTLTAERIPVVGATLTSDAFDNIKDFIRVSPTNRTDSAAALSFVKSNYTRAVLVEDQNVRDIFASTLVDGFERFADKTHTIVGKQTYDTTPIIEAKTQVEQDAATEEVANRISLMHTDICDAAPDVSGKHPRTVVLFAGRGRELAELVGALSNACLDKHITIISGDDVANLPFGPAVRQGLASHVEVYYAGLANPGEWPTAPAAPGSVTAQGQRGYTTFHDIYRQVFAGGDHSLTDGNTMMAYDAVLSSVSAIRLTGRPQPAPYMVAGALGALQGAHTVLGAGGPLRFVADYKTSTTGSNPVDKVIPILRLGPDGTSTFVALK